MKFQTICNRGKVLEFLFQREKHSIPTENQDRHRKALAFSIAILEGDVFNIPKEDDFQPRIYNQSTKTLSDIHISKICRPFDLLTKLLEHVYTELRV